MRLIKMVSVGKSSMGWDGKPFWGLVVQKGPWKSTRADTERANQKDNLTIGGGIPVGGRMSGQRSAVMTPYQIDGSSAPPEPSHHAKRSIVVGAVDMKRQGARGTRMKGKMTLGARTPVQTGHKMGGAPEESGPFLPPSEIPDLLVPSISEIDTISTAPLIAEDMDDDIKQRWSNVQMDLLGVNQQIQDDDMSIDSMPEEKPFKILPLEPKKSKKPKKQVKLPREIIDRIVRETGEERVANILKDQMSEYGYEKARRSQKPDEPILGKRKESEFGLGGGQKRRRTKTKRTASEFEYGGGGKRMKRTPSKTKRTAEFELGGGGKRSKTTTSVPRAMQTRPSAIQTTDIGERFIGRRAERGSVAKKNDELPSPKTRARKARAERR